MCVCVGGGGGGGGKGIVYCFRSDETLFDFVCSHRTSTTMVHRFKILRIPQVFLNAAMQVNTKLKSSIVAM